MTPLIKQNACSQVSQLGSPGVKEITFTAYRGEVRA